MPELRSNARTTTADAWELVTAHASMISALVDAAIHRGQVSRDNYEDAISAATLQAYELAVRPQRAAFEHQLRFVLSRSLGRKYRTDAFQGARDLGGGPIAVLERPADTDEDLQLRINCLPAHYRHIAQMAFIEGRTLARIIRRTGHRRIKVQDTLTFLRKALSV